MSVVAHPRWSGELQLSRLEALYELLASLTQAEALEDVYEAAIKSLLATTSAKRASILTFDDDGVIRFKAWHDLSERYRQAVTGHTPWQRGARGAEPILVSDVLKDESLSAYRGLFTSEGIRALVFIPLALDSGVLGKFMLYYSEPHECPADELQIAQAIAAHVAIATERKRVEIERMRTEARLQAVIDNSPAVIFVKDHAGRYLLVNRRCEELFQTSQRAMLGHTDDEIFPAEVAKRFRENDQLALSAGKPLAVEELAPQEDGLHSYISLKFPLEEHGKTIGVCGIATDITEQKRLEAANRHLAAIVESSHDAIIAEDLDGLITSWNGGAERLYGYSAQEAIGEPVSFLAASERLNEMHEILAKVRAGERVQHYETKRRRKDGTVIDVSISVSPIRDASGEIVGASTIARDITDQKQAQAKHAQLLVREQEARKTAELLNRVGPALASLLDLEKLVQEVTDIATALVGAEFGAFFHNVVNDKGESYMLYSLSGVSREAFAGFPMPRNTCVFGPTFRGEGVMRSDDITKDSRYGKNPPYNGMPKGHLPVRSYLATPVMSRNGEVLGGLFFGHSQAGRFTEIHESLIAGVAAQAGIAMDNARLFQQTKWAEIEMRRSNEELRLVNQDLESFAYSASHDLQEPLRTVSLCAQMLERNIANELNSEDANFLTTIVTASDRMTNLIEDLLAYTRATKYPEGPPPTVDARAVLETTLQALQGRIQETAATFDVGLLPAVAVHEARLSQLFQNLIGNALKYRGQEPPHICVSAAERDGWTVFSISDNGIGIDKEFSEQIFEIFKRLHSREEYEGSGVGLAICRRIVEQYGGRIWLEKSAPGQGSEFCIALPSKRTLN